MDGDICDEGIAVKRAETIERATRLSSQNDLALFTRIYDKVGSTFLLDNINVSFFPPRFHFQIINPFSVTKSFGQFKSRKTSLGC